jgi:hypothetical protein
VKQFTVKEKVMFVRTKDNQIIDIEKLRKDFDIKIVGNYLQTFHKFGFTPADTFELVCQADTIELLCDEFVLVSPYRFKRPRTASELNKTFEEMVDFYTTDSDKIYGGIYTDKGLIYVAEANEEGELELL